MIDPRLLMEDENRFSLKLETEEFHFRREAEFHPKCQNFKDVKLLEIRVSVKTGENEVTNVNIPAYKLKNLIIKINKKEQDND